MIPVIALTLIIVLGVGVGTPVYVDSTYGDQINPSSPLAYTFEKTGEKIKLALTLNPEDKAKIHLKLAEERLEELNETIEIISEDQIKQLCKEYEQHICLCMNETAKTGNITLVELVSHATIKHQLILKKLQFKVPFEAQEAIKKALDVSKKGHEKAKEVLQHKTPIEKFRLPRKK